MGEDLLAERSHGDVGAESNKNEISNFEINFSCVDYTSPGASRHLS